MKNPILSDKENMEQNLDKHTILVHQGKTSFPEIDLRMGTNNARIIISDGKIRNKLIQKMETYRSKYRQMLEDIATVFETRSEWLGLKQWIGCIGSWLERTHVTAAICRTLRRVMCSGYLCWIHYIEIDKATAAWNDMKYYAFHERRDMVTVEAFDTHREETSTYGERFVYIQNFFAHPTFCLMSCFRSRNEHGVEAYDFVLSCQNHS